jgi:hypothetical protein
MDPFNFIKYEVKMNLFNFIKRIGEYVSKIFPSRSIVEHLISRGDKEKQLQLKKHKSKQLQLKQHLALEIIC